MCSRDWIARGDARLGDFATDFFARVHKSYFPGLNIPEREHMVWNLYFQMPDIARTLMRWYADASFGMT